MTWNDCVSTARTLTDQFRADGSVAWFRGHRNESFELKSTLHRYIDRLTRDFATPPDDNARRWLLQQEYKTLYRRFKADAWPLLDPRERSEWGIIFAMQHYGLPTRLLDWTESFACAVFFALLRRRPSEDAAVWVLDPQALNSVAVGRGDLVALDEDVSPGLMDSRTYHPRWVVPPCALRSIAVSPLFTNPRMTAQRSAFTVSGDWPVSLNQEFPALVTSDRLKKILLSASMCGEASAFLEMAGLTAFTFYPDLHGLAMRHAADTEERINQARRWYPDGFKE